MNLIDKLIIEAAPQLAAEEERRTLEARHVSIYAYREGSMQVSAQLDVLDAKYLDAAIEQIAALLPGADPTAAGVSTRPSSRSPGLGALAHPRLCAGAAALDRRSAGPIDAASTGVPSQTQGSGRGAPHPTPFRLHRAHLPHHHHAPGESAPRHPGVRPHPGCIPGRPERPRPGRRRRLPHAGHAAPPPRRQAGGGPPGHRPAGDSGRGSLPPQPPTPRGGDPDLPHRRLPLLPDTQPRPAAGPHRRLPGVRTTGADPDRATSRPSRTRIVTGPRPPVTGSTTSRVQAVCCGAAHSATSIASPRTAPSPSTDPGPPPIRLSPPPNR